MEQATASDDIVPVDIPSELGVDEIGPNRYIGKKPLRKPDARNRGVYGGSLCAQVILVAMKSSPPGFRPHSLHSYFVKSVDEDTPVVWEVQEISNGRNFVNRMISAIQYGKLVYTANISLTLKNSKPDSQEEEFSFQTPRDENFEKFKSENLHIYEANPNLYIYLKTFPTKNNLAYDPERKLSYVLRWGIENEQGLHQPIAPLSRESQYMGLAALTDWIWLINVMKHIGIDSNEVPRHTVSLDHCIYFHDDDFDVTNWIGYTLGLTRISHDRALVRGEVYNDKGLHIASITQERLFLVGGRKARPKL